MDIIGILITLIKTGDIYKAIVITLLVSYFYLILFLTNTIKGYLDKIILILEKIENKLENKLEKEKIKELEGVNKK